jgi:multiple sugar transport system substrate-binding protein
VTQFPTDWNALREASRAVFERTGKAGWGFPAGSCGTPTIWFFLNYYWWSQGWGLIDKRPSEERFFVAITPQQIQEGFDYYNRYLQEGHNPRANLSVCLWGAPEIVEGMAAGNIAMLSAADPVAIQVATTWQQRNPGRPLPFASAPHPAGPNGSRTHLGGRMLGIGANTRHLEQAWTLVKFLCQPDPTFTRHYTNYTPAQLAAVESRQWPADLTGYPAQLRTARSWGPYGTGPVSIPFMWNATGRAAASVFIGEKTSVQAAQDLHDAVSRELARTQR